VSVSRFTEKEVMERERLKTQEGGETTGAPDIWDDWGWGRKGAMTSH
jgi:hypothetical protein